MAFLYETIPKLLAAMKRCGLCDDFKLEDALHDTRQHSLWLAVSNDPVWSIEWAYPHYISVETRPVALLIVIKWSCLLLTQDRNKVASVESFIASGTYTVSQQFLSRLVAAVHSLGLTEDDTTLSYLVSQGAVSFKSMQEVSGIEAEVSAVSHNYFYHTSIQHHPPLKRDIAGVYSHYPYALYGFAIYLLKVLSVFPTGILSSAVQGMMFQVNEFVTSRTFPYLLSKGA